MEVSLGNQQFEFQRIRKKLGSISFCNFFLGLCTPKNSPQLPHWVVCQWSNAHEMRQQIVLCGTESKRLSNNCYQIVLLTGLTSFVFLSFNTSFIALIPPWFIFFFLLSLYSLWFDPFYVASCWVLRGTQNLLKHIHRGI